MNTQEVADRLIAMCRQGQHNQAFEELYSDNIVSREMPGYPQEVASGKDAVREKSRQWEESIREIHSLEVSDPLVAGNHFSCKMSLDITYKEQGRQQMEEICVYEVKDGKIVNEQFFYQMGE